MNADWVKLSGIVVVGGAVAYALALVAGDNGSVVDIVKNFIHAVFVGTVATSSNG